LTPFASRARLIAVREKLDRWFVREVLPLEAALTRYLRRNWHEAADIEDLRQEVYVRAYEAATKARPLRTKPFVFAVARNLIVDRVRRAQVVAIDAIPDLDALNVSTEEAAPDRQAGAREELRRTQAAFERLPARCREVLWLRRVEGLPQKEVARRLGVREDTVEKQLANAVRRLAEALFTEMDGAGDAAGSKFERGGHDARRRD
jgi:RNA polymerase sigma-70 factor (ECF subfamily)